MNLMSMFERQVLERPDKTALIFGEEHYTYARLNAGINRCASALRALGVTRQKRVAITARNSDLYLQALLGCLKLGAIPCVLNCRLSQKELGRVVRGEDMHLILFDANANPPAAPGSLSVSLDDAQDGPSLRSLMAEQAADFPLAEAAPGDIALELFTTGTTGLPKGVLHTHGGLLYYTLSLAYNAAWTASEIYQTASPLFHISGFSAVICLLTGGTLILKDHFDLHDFLRTASLYRATRLSLQPVLISRVLESGALNDYDLSAVRKIVYGGAPMPPAVIDEALKCFSCEFEQIYGTSEICSLTILPWKWHFPSPQDPQGQRRYSVGLPNAGMEVRIIRSDGTRCAPGKLGEIIVRTPAVMKGYSNNESATRSALRDGWYYTGDIGYLDHFGFLYVVDRKYDLIISGGENICPKEVESCIGGLTGRISQVAVLGMCDPVWNEVPVAFVVRAKGSDITAEEILRYCRANIAAYKVPKKIVFMEKLPYYPSGKVVKHELKKYLNGSSNQS
ncbi:o-succinylbenzoate--CoA ligase [Syntrophobotulus glycolicus DSM 8271]|uniref:O-succinylbenzoate--CoA ligase n=1 Tax=Syntrophobotulus glycolicus (strain DSM 8271 / FlGlyR) TaxID=645991 RepID=F0SU71_SYNGF|nr:AMP-binding protein [Syntrophobotulus glycolicus]ADY55454.1 o-succinylbenzoate--CoA ligase [Syntrophobotulus glycolicus DSM 8271]